MCLPPANTHICPNPLLYSAVYHRYSLKSFQLCKSAQTYWYRRYFEHIVARFQGDSSCLTIDNIKPELCRNSAPLYNPMSVVDNSAPLFFHSSHFNYNDNKSNPLSRVLKENINKIYKMQHFSTLGNAAYKFFKTFRANPAWAECVSRDRGVEYFREDRPVNSNFQIYTTKRALLQDIYAIFVLIISLFKFITKILLHQQKIRIKLKFLSLTHPYLP